MESERATQHVEVDAVPKFEVQRELDRILESPIFRDSKRSRDFLKFVVEAKLTDRHAAVKERTLGVELFNRQPSYNTNDDSIVRVKATEIRKRLAQYNSQASGQVVRIELPRGCYIPEFFAVQDSQTVVEAGALQKRRFWLIGLSAAFVLCALATCFAISARRSPMDRFWAPVTERGGPVLICLAHPTVYWLSTRVHDIYKKRVGNLPPGPYTILPAPQDMDGSDVIPVPNQYVGAGDAQAAVSLAAVLRGMGLASRARLGSDVSFTDLRHSTAILIGWSSNRWTMEMTKDLRFTSEYGVNCIYVRDRVNPKRSWIVHTKPSITDDYAIVSRLLQPKTGQIVIAVAGCTQWGTQAAGEFLANDAYMAGALQGAPGNWERKSLQIVIHVGVEGAATTVPQVVAADYW